MSEAAIVAEGLEKRYGETVALRGVSAAVSSGEVFALVGPNGAGKTTLIRCLTGTTEPTAGRATLLGSPPSSVDRNRIGLLPQDFSPPDRLTARELIAYYAGLYDAPLPVESVLSSVGMAAAADARYADLSGGQRRRTLVGTALVNDPDVLFLDEPTTGIDPAGRRDVWGLVERLADAGTTVLLTSHSMAEVERLADRVAVLVDGELITVGTPSALLDAHGGESRLLVATDERAAVGRQLAGHAVQETENGLLIEDIEPGDVGAVIEALAAANVEYRALTWRRPDLETVYLELAGESVASPPGERPAEAGGGTP
jgi:ABC-2 type transport system ATP-binding protein